MMKLSVIVGFVGGLIFSLFNLSAMVTPMAYGTWNFINSALFMVFSIALLGLGVRSVRQNQTYGRVLAVVAIASFLFSGIYLLTYWISTSFFPDRLLQLPFFAKDYAYHGYTSPKQYLFNGNNYAELMQLQVFSLAFSVLFQIAFAGVMAGILKLSKLGVGTRTCL